jgi:Flp pilus assembly secretin CpaC
MSVLLRCHRRAGWIACAAALLGLAGTAAATERPRVIDTRVATPPVAAHAAPKPAVAPSEAIAVLVDHARILRLPERTQTVIIGNPFIADVTVQKNGIVVITGKAYGVTNMLALDPAGAVLAESMVRVQAPTESIVTVQRGLDRESYSCTPSCQPSLLLGDAPKHFSEVGDQTGKRNGFATSR